MKKVIITTIFILSIQIAKSQIVVTNFSKNEIMKVIQSITINSPANLNAGSIETAGELTFAAPVVDLTSINIKATKIIIQTTVTNINVDGSVDMVCDNFEIVSGRAAELIITGTESSSMQVHYKKSLVGAKLISDFPTNGKLFLLKFEKSGK